MRLLDVNNLSVRYEDTTIVDNVSFSVDEGQWLMIVGPNGAGKSTFVGAISQGVDYNGTIHYRGQDVKKYKPVELAKNIGVLAQNHFVGYSFTVGEVVRLGRYSHSPGIFSKKSNDEERIVDEALEITGLTSIVNQSVLTLSGGELQRTFLAQLFAQNPKLLILDEPTNHLDLVYQKQVFALVDEWLKGEGRAVISVVHDLSLAKAYGTSALLLDKGKTVAFGDMKTVFSPDNLKDAYSMDVYAWMRQMLSQWM